MLLLTTHFKLVIFCRRWELFALQHPDVDVYLLAPKKVNGMGGKTYQYDKSVNKAN
ncbi:hypothetical protein [Bacteroides faecis]|uniref:hypothetical protein n=1 Tax=Bacteroides faecis TaxID=674529 RepID=UPI002165DCFE|nr:hypothetical protein [Bacteroides faecis]MCS2551303.1 hypothetical protein [Bacteroides faecis]